MSRQKILAFVKHPESLKLVKEYAAGKNYPDQQVVQGTIQTACEKLASGTRSPEYLLVELSSKESKTAFEELDKLANFCEPDTKVVIIGDIDELSFYKELISLGVVEYLLNPLKMHQLERVMSSKTDEKKDDPKLSSRNKAESKLIAVIGSRGGAGASTIAVNMAKHFSNRQYPTVILDFDPEFGVGPLTFDVEPNRGLVDALEKPERIDALFLDRVMTKINDHLFILGAEKKLTDVERISDKAAQILIDQLKAKFAYIVVDVPRVEYYDHYILKAADNILVTELSIPGLRDTMRIYDLINEEFHNKRICLVANKTGVNKKFETPIKDFEAGLGRKFDVIVPFESDIYGYNSSGDLLIDTHKDSKLARGIMALANRFLPDAAKQGETGSNTKKSGLFDKLVPKK